MMVLSLHLLSKYGKKDYITPYGTMDIGQN